MTRLFAPALAAALCLAAPALAQTPSDYAAAVAAPGRPDDMIALDASRRPAEVLAFLGLKKGMAVADIMADKGYYSELAARVVGPRGKVVAYNAAQFVAGDDKIAAAWDGIRQRQPNASVVTYPFDGFTAPANAYDFVLLHLVYHDIYWSSEKYKVPVADPAAFVRAIYSATKPGGIVGIVDHVGPAGDTRALVDQLHRIDPAVIKADFQAAGFVLDGESDLLRMPADDHSLLVFKPEVRGKTDRVVLRFRKPK